MKALTLILMIFAISAQGAEAAEVEPPVEETGIAFDSTGIEGYCINVECSEAFSNVEPEPSDPVPLDLESEPIAEASSVFHIGRRSARYKIQKHYARRHNRGTKRAIKAYARR